MNSLVRDPLYFAQVTGPIFQDPQRNQPFAYDAISTILNILGSHFPLRLENLGREIFGCANVFDTLSKLLPMSSQANYFWRKFAKPFSAMLETAGFPPNLQCRFLTFVYARVIGMMGPHIGMSEGSTMTFDGSPVELSWVIPKSKPLEGTANRQIRFAIEPIDPRTGERLCGDDVLNYLISPAGSLGIVDCQADAMIWRQALEHFLFPDANGSQTAQGSTFFIGFEFSSAGRITLKAYYTPTPRIALSTRSSNVHDETLRLWDMDWAKLRRLIPDLDMGLSAPLEKLLSFIHELDEPLRPRIQILSVDCVNGKSNRLKIYCRPRAGTSWQDACRIFTLGGKLCAGSMADALAHLEILWNHLFPNFRSNSRRQLELPNTNRARPNKRNRQHPTEGLLFYFSLQPGKDVPLPKIYLPASRYGRNDLHICNAVEKVYDSVRNCRSGQSEGWMAHEVSKVFNHRSLKAGTGIHTYVTLAYKEKGWEVTSYFSPEVWS